MPSLLVTKEILNADEKKLTELFPDPLKRQGVKTMIQDVVARMTHADKILPGQPKAPEIAYQLGKYHPKFAQPSDAGEGDDDIPGNEDNEDSDNDLEQRLDKKSQRSSAMITGGTQRRPKSIKDLTIDDLANMPEKDFRSLRSKYPKEVEAILREG